MSIQQFDVVVVRETAIVDVIVEPTDAQFIMDEGLPLAEWQLVSREKQIHIEQQLKDLGKKYTQMAGGQLSNTIANLALLGEGQLNTAILCAFGDDDLGQYFKESLQNASVDTSGMIMGEGSSGLCMSISLTNSDLSKTMLTYLGDVKTLELIDKEAFRNFCIDTRYLLFEGYFFKNEQTEVEELIRFASEIQTLDNQGLTIGLTLSSANAAECMEVDFIRQHINLIAGNKEEFEALTGRDNFEEVNQLLNPNKDKTLIYTNGKEGAVLAVREQIEQIPPAEYLQAAEIVDVTGAGDGFLAGVLYGLLNNKSVAEAGEIATKVSTQIIKTIGARLQKPLV